MKKILALAIIVIAFVFVGILDTDETTSNTDIRQAQMQAEINRASK